MTVAASARDLPGVRLVLGHSPRAGPTRRRRHRRRRRATWPGWPREAPGPVVVALHHPPQPRAGADPTTRPPSVGATPSAWSTSWLPPTPATLIVAGHTHRNRRYQVRGLTVAEVGSTKDYPGVWAGYSVYEGGIRQVVYRVAEPVGHRLDRGHPARASAASGDGGARVSLSDRCWTLEWPQVP